MSRIAQILVVTTAAGACDPGPQLLAVSRESGAVPTSPVPATRRARSSVRCGECHGQIESSWRVSAHGRAATSQTYIAAALRSGDESCARCHAPLAAVFGADDAVAQEGVTCEVCHKTTAVALEGGGSFSMDLLGNVEFGTLCDASDHYFHRSACSRIVAESRLCAGCHEWSRTSEDGRVIPILSEYADWAGSDYAEAGVQCQDCHMPGRPGEVATGWRERPAVQRHDNPARAERGRSVRVAASAARHDDHVVVDLELHNEDAGHAVPTGLPGTRLQLRAQALGRKDVVLGEQVYEYTRLLVDARGNPVPFWRATAVGTDTRLRPGERRKEQARFAAEGVIAIRWRLSWRAPTGLATETSVPVEVLVHETRVALDERRARKDP